MATPLGDTVDEGLEDLEVVKSAPLVAIARAENDDFYGEPFANLAIALLPRPRVKRAPIALLQLLDVVRARQIGDRRAKQGRRRIAQYGLYGFVDPRFIPVEAAERAERSTLQADEILLVKRTAFGEPQKLRILERLGNADRGIISKPSFRLVQIVILPGVLERTQLGRGRIEARDSVPAKAPDIVGFRKAQNVDARFMRDGVPNRFKAGFDLRRF
jgi:hypothetical protein